MNVEIRWMVRRDMPEVLDIESQSFSMPWIEEDFRSVLRQRNCIAMVADSGTDVVGFVVYEISRDCFRMLNIAASPRRQGVGTALVRRLVEKVRVQQRKLIVAEIRESNLHAQQFFRHSNFRATGILHGHYEDTGEDAYVMQYRLCWPSLEWQPQNRVSEYMPEA